MCLIRHSQYNFACNSASYYTNQFKITFACITDHHIILHVHFELIVFNLSSFNNTVMYISVGSGLDDRVIQVTFLPSQAGLIYKKLSRLTLIDQVRLIV